MEGGGGASRNSRRLLELFENCQRDFIIRVVPNYQTNYLTNDYRLIIGISLLIISTASHVT